MDEVAPDNRDVGAITGQLIDLCEWDPVDVDEDE